MLLLLEIHPWYFSQLQYLEIWNFQAKYCCIQRESVDQPFPTFLWNNYCDYQSTGVSSDVNLGCRVAILLKSLFITPTSLPDAYKSLRIYLKCSWHFSKLCFLDTTGSRFKKSKMFSKGNLSKITLSAKKIVTVNYLVIICFYIHSVKIKFKIHEFPASFRNFLILGSLFSPDNGRKLNVFVRIQNLNVIFFFCKFLLCSSHNNFKQVVAKDEHA